MKQTVTAIILLYGYAWMHQASDKFLFVISLAFGLGMGDKVDLATPEGKRQFPVVSIVRDYSSDQGAIHIDRQLNESLWRDDRVQSVALFLRPGSSAE